MSWNDSLDNFEKQLAEDKRDRERENRHKDKHSHRDRDDDRRRHHHHHRSRRERDHDQDEHRRKRRRHDSEENDKEFSNKHHRRRSSVDGAERPVKRPLGSVDGGSVQRDSWMEAPSSIGVEHVQRKVKDPSPSRQGSLGQDFEMKLHEKELNRHLKDLQAGKALDDIEGGDVSDSVDQTFGDSGSSWRMTKLRAVYRQAKESGRKVDEVAAERYGNLREFDDAREEEMELDRRDTYGKSYVGKEKPSGELYQERKLDSGPKEGRHEKESDDEFDQILDSVPVPAPVAPTQVKPDQTQINKLKAQLMKAELKKDPNVESIRKQYEEALSGAPSATDPTVIHLSAMDSRMLSSAPRNEVITVTDRRGRERGNVVENEDMTIEDMIAEERRTKGQGAGEAERFAERIAKDAKFDNDLEYMDENANKLAKRVHKSDLNLRNMAIGDYQKVNKILENCPLCHHEDRASESEQTPVAPIVSLATRAYLTLPTRPELAHYSAMIVPTQHHTNLIHCDDDEWEEIRNFMKSLTRFYHSRDRDVIFYENAAFPNRRPHAALVAVPLPQSVGETSPAFFKEAFLTTESEWSQHKKIIDTLGKAKNGLGKLAFRRSLVKEMPYFHVWFEMDGGLGHVVEDPDKWPRGDLFAREVIGGMLGLETETIKKQGKWHKGGDRERVESFRKRWHKWDWTRVLVEGST